MHVYIRIDFYAQWVYEKKLIFQFFKFLQLYLKMFFSLPFKRRRIVPLKRINKTILRADINFSSVVAEYRRAYTQHLFYQAYY